MGSFRRTSLATVKEAAEAQREQDEARVTELMASAPKARNKKLEARTEARKAAQLSKSPSQRKLREGGAGTQLARIHHSSAVMSAMGSPTNLVGDDEPKNAGVGITFWVVPQTLRRGHSQGKDGDTSEGFDIVVLAVDPDGPADQGILKKGVPLLFPCYS